MVATASGGTFPVNLDVATPDHVARWRPLVLWLLAIPLFVVQYVFGIAAQVVVFLGWFAALFTGALPDSFGRFLTGYLRFTWRTTAYLYALTTVYPSFELPMGDADPGGDMATMVIVRAPRLSRLTVFFRLLLVIPQVIVLYFVGIAAGVVTVVAWFAILITGHWPEGLRRFFVGYHRWAARVSAYSFLLVDQYPPFSLT